MASTVGHHSGFEWGVRLALHLGARLVLQETWDPAVFVHMIEKERITFCWALRHVSPTRCAPRT